MYNSSSAADNAESCEIINEIGKEKTSGSKKRAGKTRSRKRSCESQFSPPAPLVAPDF